MNYIALPAAFFVTLVSIHLLRPLARKAGLVDIPGGRKTHDRDTPLIGGIGIFLGLLAGLFMNPEILATYRPLLAISCLLLLTGLVDDYLPLPAIVRLAIQVLAAWLMYSWGDNRLQTLGRLFTDSEFFLGRWAMVMTIFATVGVVNAINMIDGMDGLSGGLGAVCLLFLAVAAFWSGNSPALFTIAITALACLAAFLLVNYRAPMKKPALVYLGDSGSTMLGFVLAWLLIEASQGGADRVMPASVALWFVAIPLMDTVYLFISRPLTGKSPFEPGTDHLHHLMAMHGMPKAKVVLLLWVAGFLLGGAGLAIYAVSVMERFSVYGFLVMFVLYVLIMRLEKKGV